jgi:two-component system, NarL family, response regulator LiaR
LLLQQFSFCGNKILRKAAAITGFTNHISQRLCVEVIFSLSFCVTTNFLQRNRSVIFYSLCLAVLLFILNWLKLRLVIIDHAFEIYIGAIAVLFTALGIWLGLKLTRPKTVIVKQEVLVDKTLPFTVDEEKLTSLAISKREFEVLQAMAEGLSNQEIADKLFISLSTVKSHSNNLFDKLEVKRRTQAIEQARKLNLIP